MSAPTIADAKGLVVGYRSNAVIILSLGPGSRWALVSHGKDDACCRAGVFVADQIAVGLTKRHYVIPEALARE